MSNLISTPAESTAKKRRNLPGNPDPDAEVIALSPKSLMATNRFMCEVCNKGFQRDQNLQLHRRGHNLPWKLKQRPSKELIRKKVYICPEASCVHHSPSRALGDLTGIKKHFSRKHGEKRYRCDKCSKKYAVHSDWKAHSKTCGTREYRCDCGTIFSRRDSFVTHRAFCDALTEESSKAMRLPPNPNCSMNANIINNSNSNDHHHPLLALPDTTAFHQPADQFPHCNRSNNDGHHDHQIWAHETSSSPSSSYLHHIGPLIPSAYHHQTSISPHLSATALLQKAAEMGATLSRPSSNYITTQMAPHDTSSGNININITNAAPLLQEMLMMSPPGLSASEVSTSSNNAILGKIEEGQELTRDFLGLKALSHKDMIFSMAGFQSLDPCMKLGDI